jgi:hypothetical protein
MRQEFYYIYVMVECLVGIREFVAFEYL